MPMRIPPPSHVASTLCGTSEGLRKDEAVTQRPGSEADARAGSPGGRSLLIALVLVAFNLRPPLTALPTLVSDIRADLGYGAVAIGALTTLPILAMGGLAFVVPGLAARFGAPRVVWFATAVLVLASGMRLASSVPGVLPLSALLSGAGIALAGGLVPGLVRERMPDRIGTVTGLWTSTMLGGAGIAAALTVPLSHLLGSWQEALAFWAIPALIGLVAWSIVEPPRRAIAARGARVSLRSLPWRSPVAWAITTFLSMNSVLFYSSVAWLAPSYLARGMSPGESGLLLGVFAAVGTIAALIFPPWIHRTRRPRALLVGVVLVTTAALLGIALVPMTLPWVWVVVFGLVNTAWFTMALTLIGMVSADGHEAARITAMAYTVMYLMAAVGPVACGALLAVTGSWEGLFLALAGVSALGLLIAPRLATQPR